LAWRRDKSGKGLAWLGRPQVAMHSQFSRFLVTDQFIHDHLPLLQITKAQKHHAKTFGLAKAKERVFAHFNKI